MNICGKSFADEDACACFYGAAVVARSLDRCHMSCLVSWDLLIRLFVRLLPSLSFMQRYWRPAGIQSHLLLHGSETKLKSKDDFLGGQIFLYVQTIAEPHTASHPDTSPPSFTFFRRRCTWFDTCRLQQGPTMYGKACPKHVAAQPSPEQNCLRSCLPRELQIPLPEGSTEGVSPSRSARPGDRVYL